MVEPDLFAPRTGGEKNAGLGSILPTVFLDLNLIMNSLIYTHINLIMDIIMDINLIMNSLIYTPTHICMCVYVN